MRGCWQNDPDARPTFTKLKDQLKGMETLHKVRIVINLKLSFYVRVTGLGSAIDSFQLNSIPSKRLSNMYSNL